MVVTVLLSCQGCYVIISTVVSCFFLFFLYIFFNNNNLLLLFFNIYFYYNYYILFSLFIVIIFQSYFILSINIVVTIVRVSAALLFFITSYWRGIINIFSFVFVYLPMVKKAITIALMNGKKKEEIDWTARLKFNRRL